MSDPAVTAYLTKLLCSHGGRLERERLGDFLDLPMEQIEQILQDEPLRFPQSSQLVLAQSALRICSRYLYPNDPEGEEDEEKCLKLHLCRHYLRGQCPPHRRPRCRFNHDVLSDHNRAVLKANELSGLNENEIKVLLFQNDNQLLPEDCSKYMHGSCDQGNDCTRLHMCRFFTRGECNRRFCKRSHNLLESKIILTCSWLTQETVQNFQMLCVLNHNKRHQEGAIHEEARNAQRLARGRGRGRGRPRYRKRNGSKDLLEGRSRERKIDGPRFPFRSTSRPALQCSSGKRSGDEDHDDSSSDSDNHGTNSEISNDNVIPPCHTATHSRTILNNTNPTATHIGPQPKLVSGYCRPLSSAAASPSVFPITSSTTPVTSPMGVSLKAETRLSTDVSSKPSATSNIAENPSVKSSPIPDQKLIVEISKAASSLLPGPDNISPTSSSTSKTLYSTGEISYNAQLKQISGSERPLNPPAAGASKVQTTPSATLVTSPLGASLKAETSVTTDIASPKLSAASNITQNLSTKSSSISNQKTIVDSSPVTGSSKVFPSSSATVTVQLNPSTSPSNPLSSSSGTFRVNTPSNKPVYAMVEPMPKSDVPRGNQYTLSRDDNRAFNLPPKSTNSTAPQLQPSININSESLKKASVDKTPEICLSNIWKFCKFGGRCIDMHYYLPYRWQELNGTDWCDLPNMEHIETAYCDPNIVRYQSVDFKTMKVGTRRVRRLTTPSSVTRPREFVLTTEWLWYWKDEYGTWTKYGELNTKKVSSSISSSDLETIYLSDPSGTITFTAANQNYTINFQEMKQRNIYYRTEKDVCRRPKFLDFEKVKMLKGSTKSTENLTQKSSNLLLKTVNYPVHWCLKALPEMGYQKVLVLENSEEFLSIVKIFSKTVSGQVVKKLWRVQNPTLWQVYQWQKDQMKKKKSGMNVDERQLFHGTNPANIDAICRDNFDWRVCGTNGTVFGQGSYFARDASYSHNYSVPTSAGSRTMFVARVLVGDFVTGDSQMRRPPQKSNRTDSYDSCVDDVRVPSIFVVFERFQVYPEYILEYEEVKKSSCVIS